jgi:hypothetical protein
MIETDIYCTGTKHKEKRPSIKTAYTPHFKLQDVVGALFIE